MKQYNLKQKVMNFLNDEQGASGIEYALIAAMVAVVLALFAGDIGGQIDTIFGKIQSALESANETE